MIKYFKLYLFLSSAFCSSILCGQNMANVSYGSCLQSGAFLFEDAVAVCLVISSDGTFNILDCNYQQTGGINGFFNKTTALSVSITGEIPWLKVSYSNGCDVYLRDPSWIVFAPPLPPTPPPAYNFCLGPDTDYSNLEIISDCDISIQPGGFQGGNKLVVIPKLDNDTDGDGTPNEEDAFPNDPNEWLDTDGDTIGNNADTDDDNDGYLDANDAFPLDASEWLDTDGDDIGNNADTDDDNDTYLDDNDAFPLDASEWLDTDGDDIGNNADTDDDNDGYLDINDAFPLDVNEWLDTDGDTIGNNADTDDDNDTILDYKEIEIGSNPLVLDTLQSLVSIIDELTLNNSSKLSIDEIKDLRPGSTMLEVTGNQATVQLQMEESSDLQSWEDTGTPATMTIPADTDTKFFRFKMAD